MILRNKLSNIRCIRFVTCTGHKSSGKKNIYLDPLPHLTECILSSVKKIAMCLAVVHSGSLDYLYFYV